MITRTVIFADELFAFSCMADWINHGKERFAAAKERGLYSHRILLLDAMNRVVTCGAGFTRALRDDAYPVTAYDVGEG